MYTRNVWIVSPAYMLAFRIFEDSALKLRAVPEDDEGIDIDFLKRELKKSEEIARSQGNNEPVSLLRAVVHLRRGSGLLATLLRYSDTPWPSRPVSENTQTEGQCSSLNKVLCLQ